MHLSRTKGSPHHLTSSAVGWDRVHFRKLNDEAAQEFIPSTATSTFANQAITRNPCMRIHFIAHESFEAPGAYEDWVRTLGYEASLEPPDPSERGRG